jgi:hypothetical protein
VFIFRSFWARISALTVFFIVAKYTEILNSPCISPAFKSRVNPTQVDEGMESDTIGLILVRLQCNTILIEVHSTVVTELKALQGLINKPYS